MTKRFPAPHCVAAFATALTAFAVSAPRYTRAAEEMAPAATLELSRHPVVGLFIAEALQANPGLDAHRLRYEAARQTIVSARALPDPRIQITQFVESIETRVGPQRNALMVQQPLPWPGKRNARQEDAAAQAEALWHAYANQQLAVVEEVAILALEIAALDKSIEIQEENLDLLGQLQSVADERVRAGAKLTDLLRVQMEISQWEDQTARLRAERIAKASRLLALLGREPNGDLPLPPLQGDPREWAQQLESRNPQLAMLRKLEASKTARERLARLSTRPELSVGVNYINTGEAANPAMAPDSGKDPWAIMIGFSLPIWGKANESVVAQAGLETDATRAQIEDLKLTLSAKARALIATIRDAESRLDRFESSLLPLARQAREINESSYRSGQLTILELIDSERSLLRLETEYWKAAADAWIARWRLATLSGGYWQW